LSGLITHVQADLISVEAIPFPLREFLLQTPSRLNDFNETADEEYQNNSDDLSCSQSNEMSNQSVANESQYGSEHHAECSYLDAPPDVVFIEDVFEDKEVYVDEVYEFGAAENCVDSGEEDLGSENVDDNEEATKMTCLGIKYDAKAKLDIYLKEEKKFPKNRQIDLREVVRNVLQSEQDEQIVFKNLDAENEVCGQLESLRLDLKQKVLNEGLFATQLFPNEDGKYIEHLNFFRLRNLKDLFLKKIDNLSLSRQQSFKRRQKILLKPKE